jgi:dipeptidyl aminopeptidase/acylaminoacyl peptidase
MQSERPRSAGHAAFRSTRAASALLSLALLGCRSADPPPGPPERAAALAPPPDGVIVFVAERAGRRAIEAVDPAGQRRRTLYAPEGDAYPVAAGPDGGLLAITARGANDAAHRESLALVGEGGRVEPLGLSGRFVRRPGFAGRAIVAESDHFGFRDLVELDLASGRLARLTTEPSGCFEPAVSPDGRSVLFVSSVTGDPEIYRIERGAADRAWQRLSWSRGEDGEPAWSPDGRTVAFVSARRGPSLAHLMQADGGKPRPLSPAPEAVAQREPRFSPDGSLVAFIERTAPGRAGLRVVHATDGRPVFASRGEWLDQTPAFSPDGRHVAFASRREGQTDLYRVRLHDGAVTRVTAGDGAAWLPLWLRRLPNAG